MVPAPAALVLQTVTHVCNVDKDNVDTDPFVSDEELEDNKTIVDDEQQNSQTLNSSTYTSLY